MTDSSRLPGDDKDPLYPKTGGLLRRLQQETPPEQPVQPFTTEISDADLDHHRIQREADELGEDPEVALARLEEKMQRVTQDYNNGLLNQAQFQAMYTHYTEKRAVIMRLLDRSPESDAWKRVAREGITTALRRQHEARVEGLAVFDNFSGSLIHILGDFDLPDEILQSLLRSLNQSEAAVSSYVPQPTQIEGGRWLCYLRGEYATSVSVYTQEPSPQQMIDETRVFKAFEQDNTDYLESGQFDVHAMYWPQQDLLR